MWLEIGTAPPLDANDSQEAAQPRDARGVQPVRGLVQDQDLRFAQQRRREREPLLHPQRELAHAPGRERRHAGGLEHAVDPTRAEAALDRDDPQMVAGRPARVEAGELQGGSDLRERSLERDVGRSSTNVSPWVGAASPRRTRIVVDLPAPFGPRNPVTDPCGTAKLRSWTATVSP